MRALRLPVRFIAALALAMAGCAAWAQDAPALDASLNEAVVMVPKKGALFDTELETTIFKPAGDGPFPVVIINHGKAAGDPRFQGRYRPRVAARVFVRHGYAVVVPMRQGFSKSGGSYIGGGCNVQSNGRVQAEDVKATLDWVVAQPWADKDHMLVAGQSHGGWTTLAFGTQGYPGVRALANFAGGLRQEGCIGWKDGLIGAATNYGKETKLPSIWFYGDNDSYFEPYVWRGMFDGYTAAGAKAQLVAFGVFPGGDSHPMFNSSAGPAIWQPQLGAFLRAAGMPWAVRARQPAGGASTDQEPGQ